MPMPTPDKGESLKDFIARFMSDEAMRAEFADSKQRVAVAYAQARRKRGLKALATRWQRRVDLAVGMGQRWAGHVGEAGGSGRTVPVRVTDVGEAVDRILKGEVVEVTQVRKVNTVLTRLAALVQDAKRRGEAAPTYDLCKVSIPGTNLFCGDVLRTEQYPRGVPRVQMPQLKGKPVPGSPADQLPKEPSGSVNAADAFVAHLQSLGVGSTSERVPAAALRASQSELVGPNVVGMMTKPGFDPAAKPIFISRDNYVLDGHHRWAAVVGLDAGDDKMGDLKMNVVRLDAPIAEVLHVAQAWTKQFGLQPKATDVRADLHDAAPPHRLDLALAQRRIWDEAKAKRAKGRFAKSDEDAGRPKQPPPPPKKGAKPGIEQPQEPPPEVGDKVQAKAKPGWQGGKVPPPVARATALLKNAKAVLGRLNGGKPPVPPGRPGEKPVPPGFAKGEGAAPPEKPKRQKSADELKKRMAALDAENKKFGPSDERQAEWEAMRKELKQVETGPKKRPSPPPSPKALGAVIAQMDDDEREALRKASRKRQTPMRELLLETYTKYKDEPEDDSTAETWLSGRTMDLLETVTTRRNRRGGDEPRKPSPDEATKLLSSVAERWQGVRRPFDLTVGMGKRWEGHTTAERAEATAEAVRRAAASGQQPGEERVRTRADEDTPREKARFYEWMEPVVASPPPEGSPGPVHELRRLEELLKNKALTGKVLDPEALNYLSMVIRPFGPLAKKVAEARDNPALAKSFTREELQQIVKEAKSRPLGRTPTDVQNALDDQAFWNTMTKKNTALDQAADARAADKAAGRDVREPNPRSRYASSDKSSAGQYSRPRSNHPASKLASEIGGYFQTDDAKVQAAVDDLKKAGFIPAVAKTFDNPVPGTDFVHPDTGDHVTLVRSGGGWLFQTAEPVEAAPAPGHGKPWRGGVSADTKPNVPDDVDPRPVANRKSLGKS